MGFNPLKMKMLSKGLERDWLKLWEGDLSAIRVASNIEEYPSMMTNDHDEFLKFEPSRGWRGHIEIRPRSNGQ
jgi:hypothetical protein